VRFVLELIPTEHGRVEGVLVREGQDERQRFSGWLDLLRLLEGAAQVTALWQRTGAHGDTEDNDVDAAGGHGHVVVGPDQPRGPPGHHRLAGEAVVCVAAPVMVAADCAAPLSISGFSWPAQPPMASSGMAQPLVRQDCAPFA
jgi:hypothetical protein